MKTAQKIQPLTLNEYFGAESIERAAELYTQLQRPIIGGVDLEINLRLLLHWVTVLKENTKGKRKKYSFTEFVWLKIVEQLRNAGLNFPTISKLKANLLEPIKLKGIITKLQQAKEYINDLNLSKEQKEQLLNVLASTDAKNISNEITFTILHIAIMECILKKLPLSFAVFLDGSFIIIDKTKEHLYSETDNNKILFDTHITVSLSKILEKFLRSELAGSVVPEIGLFAPVENKLFELVNNGEYQSLTIQFKDKKNKAIELKKNVINKERILDIINIGAFDNMLVRKNKTEIEKFENTFKVRL